MPRDTLLDFFDDRIRSDRPFLVYDGGYRSYTWSYDDIRRAALGFAERLQRFGLAPGDRVVLWGEKPRRVDRRLLGLPARPRGGGSHRPARLSGPGRAGRGNRFGPPRHRRRRPAPAAAGRRGGLGARRAARGPRGGARRSRDPAERSSRRRGGSIRGASGPRRPGRDHLHVGGHGRAQGRPDHACERAGPTSCRWSARS